MADDSPRLIAFEATSGQLFRETPYTIQSVNAATVSTYMGNETASAAFSRISFSSCGMKLPVEQTAAAPPTTCTRTGP
jgi:hypothetical protein